MSARHPLIGVVGRLLADDRVTGWGDRATAIQRMYLDSVARAGAVPVVLDPRAHGDGELDALLGRLDGVVLTGGDDLDPSWYSDERHPAVYGTDRGSDEYELALLDALLAHDVPTLAVCRGIQLVNVARRGTLLQHLADPQVAARHGIPGPAGHPVEHVVALEHGSLVAEVMGTTTPTCVSHHHQALDRLGDGLVVTGRAEDGVVEAAELVGRDRFLAVQWHPEESAHRDPTQQALFDWLARQAVSRG